MDRFWERYIQSRPAPGTSKGAFDAFAAAHKEPRITAQEPRIGFSFGKIVADTKNELKKVIPPLRKYRLNERLKYLKELQLKAKDIKGSKSIAKLLLKKDKFGRPFFSDYMEKLNALEDLQTNKYLDPKTNKAFTPKEWLEPTKPDGTKYSKSSAHAMRDKFRDPQAYLDKKSAYQRDYMRKRIIEDPVFAEHVSTKKKESYYSIERKKRVSSAADKGRRVLVEERNKLLSYMSKAAKDNPNYIDIIKDGKFLGVTDKSAGINYYEAGYKGKLGKNSKLITAHPDFENVNNLAKLADKYKRSLPNKAISSYFSAYERVPTMGEMYNFLQADPRYVGKMSEKYFTDNPLHLHHQATVTDSPAQRISLLLQDKNNRAGLLMEEFKKENITKKKLNTGLKKLNATYYVDGKPIGAIETSPETQVRTAKTQTTKLFEQRLKENPKLVQEMTEKLKINLKKLCPKGQASGGRIGFANAGSAVSTLECGRRAFTKLVGSGTANAEQKTILNEILRMGSGLMRGAGQMLNPKEFFKLRNLVGPGAWAAMGAFEAGIIGYDTINNNTPLNEALSDNWVTGWAMPWTKKEAQIKNLGEANVSGSPAMQKYMEQVKLMAEYERGEKELNFRKKMGASEEHITNQQAKLDEINNNWVSLQETSMVERDGEMVPVTGGELEFQKAVSDMEGERKAGKYDPSDLRNVNKYGYTDVGESAFKGLPLIGDWFKQGTPIKKDPQIVRTDLPPQLSTSGYHAMPKYDVDLTKYKKQPGVAEATTTPLDADQLQMHSEYLRNLGYLEPRGELPEWYIDMVQKNEKWRQLFEQSSTGLHGARFAGGGLANLTPAA